MSLGLTSEFLSLPVYAPKELAQPNATVKIVGDVVVGRGNIGVLNGETMVRTLLFDGGEV